MTDIFRFIRFFVSVASGQAADVVAARNLLSDAISPVPTESVRVGTTDTAMYYPRLAGKRVALLANHTSRIGERHLVDILHARGFDVTAIFAPEHGFRGTADSGERPIPESTWEVPSMRRQVFRSGRSATGTRGGLPTRRCTRSRWREQVGCGRVIPKLYRAIGCLRRFRAGSHWPGAAQSQRNAHRRTDSRRTIRGGVEYVCRMVVEGYAAEEIRNRWREDIGLSRIQRKPSLLYEERPLFRSIRE